MRIYFNVNAGPETPWCVDMGPGTQRWHFANFKMTAPTVVFFRYNPASHPKAWIEVHGCEVHVKENREAEICPAKTEVLAGPSG